MAGAVQRLRGLDLQKPPGVAEAIDWVGACPCSGCPARPRRLGGTLGSALKYREDLDVALDRGAAWVAGGD